jgi:hypothetical protein
MWDVSATPSGIKREWYVCMYDYDYDDNADQNSLWHNTVVTICSFNLSVEQERKINFRLVWRKPKYFGSDINLLLGHLELYLFVIKIILSII